MQLYARIECEEREKVKCTRCSTVSCAAGELDRRWERALYLVCSLTRELFLLLEGSTTKRPFQTTHRIVFLPLSSPSTLDSTLVQ